MNFQDWAVTDIPGQGSLDLNTFLCKQPVSVVVYDFTAPSASATAHKARWVAGLGTCRLPSMSSTVVPPAVERSNRGRSAMTLRRRIN